MTSAKTFALASLLLATTLPADALARDRLTAEQRQARQERFLMALETTSAILNTANDAMMTVNNAANTAQNIRAATQAPAYPQPVFTPPAPSCFIVATPYGPQIFCP
jgi:hypothetical protein